MCGVTPIARRIEQDRGKAAKLGVRDSRSLRSRDDTMSDRYRKRLVSSVAVVLVAGAGIATWQNLRIMWAAQAQEEERAAMFARVAHDRRQSRQEGLEEEGGIVLQGTLHEPGDRGRLSSAFGTTPFPKVTGSVHEDDVTVSIVDCHPCHAPSPDCDHTSYIAIQLHSATCAFADIVFRCSVLNETGSFYVEMPRGDFGAICSALRKVGADREPPTRADFQRCLDTLYGHGSARDKRLAVERLIRVLARAVSMQLRDA
jgi:hypothetical protein